MYRIGHIFKHKGGREERSEKLRKGNFIEIILLYMEIPNHYIVH